MRARRTIAAPVVRVGLGVHGGRTCHAEVAPGPPGSGIRVNGTRAHHAAVIDGRGATTLSTLAGPVRMVEHLLAALAIAGVDDARVTVAGGEVPILDGSAAGWPLDARAHGGRVAPSTVATPCRVDGFGGWIEVAPADRLILDVSIEFPEVSQRICVTALDDLRDARTFGRLAELPRLHAMGLARGASHVNTVVLDAPHVPWRSPDEPVRHKALDLLGDLMLLGHPFVGRVRAHRSSHRLHHRLVSAILDQQSRA